MRMDNRRKGWISVFALFLCMVLLAGCQGGASDVPQVTREVAEAMEKDSDKDVQPLQEETEIPGDGIITKEQIGTIAGKEGTYYFLGETGEGIGYRWAYDGAKIQNPVEQKLKVECVEDGLDEIRAVAGKAPYGLGVTLQEMHMAAPATLTLTLDEAWDADRVLFCSYEDGKIYQLDEGRISQVEEEGREVSQVSFQVARAGETFYVLGGSSKGGTAKAEGKSQDKDGKDEHGKDKDSGGKGGADGQTASAAAEGQGLGGAAHADNQETDGSDTPDQDAAGKEQSGGDDPYQVQDQPQGADSQPQGDGQDQTHTCTFSIECSTLLDNWDDVKEEKKEFVPADGWVVQPTEVTFTPGESVFDVLKRVCQERGILMESSYTPMYGSYYVEGINQLYEFDGGGTSGWMFCVNSWYPNYGCSSYTVEDGDVIEWRYTCSLGSDVGNAYMGEGQ